MDYAFCYIKYNRNLSSEVSHPFEAKGAGEAPHEGGDCGARHCWN